MLPPYRVNLTIVLNREVANNFTSIRAGLESFGFSCIRPTDPQIIDGRRVKAIEEDIQDDVLADDFDINWLPEVRKIDFFKEESGASDTIVLAQVDREVRSVYHSAQIRAPKDVFDLSVGT
ncbi:hypothetical protein EON80_18860 [bacterium]|nr:MAG: hypothetical protein EON80_18860 [bacterium]